jgi:hypothetical protein
LRPMRTASLAAFTRALHAMARTVSA